MKLQPGEDLNDWLAVNSNSSLHDELILTNFLAVDFFNQINLLYGAITDICTAQSCAVMSAGTK